MFGRPTKFVLVLCTLILGVVFFYISASIRNPESWQLEFLAQVCSTLASFAFTGLTILLGFDWAVHQIRVMQYIKDIRIGDRDSARIAYTYLSEHDLVNKAIYEITEARLNWRGLHIHEALDLSYMNLDGSNFQSATLAADFRDTSLVGANFQYASLAGCNFEGADLRGADLTSAQVFDAFFTPQTTMPDGSKWASRADLKRFVNPPSDK